MKPQGQLMVWNLGCVDDAAALAIAYLQCGLYLHFDDLTVYHPGDVPNRPMEWHTAEVRGVPGKEWLQPASERALRWAPRQEVLEKVMLGTTSGEVDLVLTPHLPAEPARDRPPALSHLRQDGYLFVIEPASQEPPPGREFAPIDSHGHLFKKVTPSDLTASTPSTGPAERTLARHDEETRLVSSYTNLARALARRYRNRGERSDDLEQVATLALVKAARRYSPERGGFAGFATTSILGELKRHFRDRLWLVRPPRSVQELNLAVRAAKDELAQAHGASPTIGEIAEHLGTTEEDVLTAMEAAENCWATSLDAPSPREDSTSTEVPVQDDGFDRTLDHRQLQEAMPRLSPTEKLMIKRLYFDGDTQRQVAGELGISQMQVSRLMSKTLYSLRQACETA